MLEKLDPSGDSMEEMPRADAQPQPQMMPRSPLRCQPTAGMANNGHSSWWAMPLPPGKPEQLLKTLKAQKESAQVAKLKAKLAKAKQDAAEAKRAARDAKAELLNSGYPGGKWVS